MTIPHDPELDDILQDGELIRVADLLRAGRMADPPIDDAFRSALRRQLMNRAWGMGESGVSWWSRAFGPANLAWAGATVGVILIAAVVVLMATNSSGGLTREVIITSPMSDQSAVHLRQPILVRFNQAMDHQSTQDAVQIAPATTVAYSWDANTLAVLPTSGDLAPNTQYQVTIGPGAKTASGQLLNAPKTITFVTAAPPVPSPSPTAQPSPTPNGVLADQRQLVDVLAHVSSVQWAADSSTVYFITVSGALDSVPAAGRKVTELVPDGVTSVVIPPGGDHVAYIRGGKIEILSLGAGTTAEIAPEATPKIVGWTKDGVEWAAADGVYGSNFGVPVRETSFPSSGTITPLSFSPDGAHLAYTQDQSLRVLDITTGKSSVLGLSGAQFLGWSPDGTGVLYTGAQAIVSSDAAGKTISTTLPVGEPSWSSQDEILLGGDTDLFEVRPDGSGLISLAHGTYHSPVWAPNGTAFTYFRAGALFTASAPLPPRPAALDAASSVVSAFMQARKAAQVDKASGFLDDRGKSSYSGAKGGLNLLVTGDLIFSRYYVLTQEITGTLPDSAQFVVRIVLARDKLDVSTYEETLSLVRTQGSGVFLIDKAAGGPSLGLGKSAQVVSVDVARDGLKITFDSDLMPATVPGGVIILDSKGKQVGDSPVYANRTVTIRGLDFKEGAAYKLVVLPTVQDVSGINIAAEYDLAFFGPRDSRDADRSKNPTPSPEASPSATPSGPPAG